MSGSLEQEEKEMQNAEYYESMGKLQAARLLLERCLKSRHNRLGPQNLETARCAAALGKVLKKQGEYVLSKAVLERSLLLLEECLNEAHVEVAECLDCLCMLLHDSDRAQTLCQRAIAIYERATGNSKESERKMGLKLATALTNLGIIIRRAKGDLDLALLHHGRALHLRKNLLEASNPEIANCLNNIAAILFLQGKYASTKHLYQQALLILENAYGPNHPQIATTLSNLAFFSGPQMRRSPQAIQLLSRAISIRHDVLGPSHHLTRISKQRLNELIHQYSTQVTLKGNADGLLPLFPENHFAPTSISPTKISIHEFHQGRPCTTTRGRSNTDDYFQSSPSRHNIKKIKLRRSKRYCLHSDDSYDDSMLSYSN